MKKDYNWQEDPANEEEVKKLSWWERPENKTTIPLPVSIINDGTYWWITTNEETKKVLGESINVSVSGNTEEEVVENFFKVLKVVLNGLVEAVEKYQKWIPFRKGSWKGKGTFWFQTFGVCFYFRYGKNMKHGWYFPFTKLNIQMTNLWAKNRNDLSHPFWFCLILGFLSCVGLYFSHGWSVYLFLFLYSLSAFSALIILFVHKKA